MIISTENLLLSFTSFFPLTSHHYLFFYLFLTSSEDSCWHRKPTEAVKTGKLEIAPYCFVAVLCSFLIRLFFVFTLYSILANIIVIFLIRSYEIPDFDPNLTFDTFRGQMLDHNTNWPHLRHICGLIDDLNMTQ